MADPAPRPTDRTLLVHTIAGTFALSLLAGVGGGGPGLLVGVAALIVADLTRDRAARLVTTFIGALFLAVSVTSAGDLRSGLLVLVTLGVLGPAWPRIVVALGAVTALVLLGGSVLGVYLTVPDTEEILRVAPVILPAIAVLAHHPPETDPPRVTALLGVVIWAAAQGGRGRPGAVIGGLACLMLVAAPLAAHRVTRSHWALALVVTIQSGAVLATSRVAGLEASAAMALAIAVPIALLTVVTDTVVLRCAPVVDLDAGERVD